MVMVEASKLSALTVVICAKTLRLPRLIFLLMVVILNTPADNVGQCSIRGATCVVTFRRSIITDGLRVRSVHARTPRKVD